jgi:glycosyltransferase involved in cell wall biosynthesis
LAAALAHGRPVVALDGAEHWDELLEASAVTVVEPAAGPLADALARLLLDDAGREASAAKAAAFAENHLSPAKVAARVLEVVDGVVGANNERSPAWLIRPRRRLPKGVGGASDHLAVPGVGGTRDDVRTRVALVAHDVHDHGGMERACAELVRNCHGEVAFTVVAAELAPELRPLVERWVHVRVPRRPFPLKFATFFARAGFALRRLDVDLVHTVGAIVPNRVDLATVHFCHAGYRVATGLLAPKDAPAVRRVNSTLSRALAVLAERWCYRSRRLRAFAAVSEGIAAEVQTHYAGIPMSITPNGIDTGRFRPDPTSRAALRAHHGIGADQCVALFVGGDWDRKGLALAVEALAKARTDGVDAVLWVVGPGDEARFRTIAAAFGVEDAISFFGRRADTECYYQAADIFVLPSAYETFSIVSFEAAASGLPLVVSMVYGAGELVGADEAGVIVEREASNVAAALVALAGDPARRAALGAEAQHRASGFTWEASAGSVADLYRSLLDEASS